MAMRAAMLAVSTALIFAGHARGASSDVCAQFEDPLAYNACLARQGPQAHGARATRDRGGRGTASAIRETHGRQRMEFTVSPR